MSAPELETMALSSSDRPMESARSVFLRLFRYGWRYKARALVSVFFAMFIAASFGSLLYTIGMGLKVTLYKAPTPAMIAAGQKAEPDPADEVAANLVKGSEHLRKAIGWAPERLDQRFHRMVDRMREKPMFALGALCALVVIAAFVVGLARFLQEYLAGTVCVRITADLERDMFRGVIQQPMGFFEMTASGEILSRFANDAFTVAQGLMDVFIKLMREPFKAVAFMAIAVSVDPWLALIGACVLPPVFYVLILIGKRMRRSMRKSLERIATMVSAISETIRGVLIVKGYNMEEYETKRVDMEVERLQRYLRRLIRLDATAGPVTEFMMVLGAVIFVMISGYRVSQGSLDLAGVTQLYLSLLLMFDPLRKLSSVNNILQKSAASAERVFEFIDLKPTIVEAPNPIELPRFSGTIRFDGVRFSYDSKAEVLKGIDLEIRKGEVVAIVGSSGAGKSTLVKLLPRFYDVSSGSISIDGVDIRQASFASLREKISIVTQDTILFDDSIRNNIAYGQNEYTDERIREAAGAAHALEFIEKLEERFDAVIGESGCTLSGGQRQRLAIARAIIKDPAILILDEATSSLDSESERLIQDALDRFVAGRTAIIIAHRLSTVQRADRILVMDDGRIVEQGTHQELLAHGGIYSRLHAIQFGVQNAGK
jgi:subfamily B ATP-binding cassette protein MsbA